MKNNYSIHSSNIGIYKNGELLGLDEVIKLLENYDRIDGVIDNVFYADIAAIAEAETFDYSAAYRRRIINEGFEKLKKRLIGLIRGK